MLNIVEVINTTFDEELAMMQHPGLVKVTWPDAFQDQGAMNVFTSIVLEQEIQTETVARVVINERTGTIVAGGDVVIDDVMISHGSIQVRTQNTPLVSQPPAFSGGAYPYQCSGNGHKRTTSSNYCTRTSDFCTGFSHSTKYTWAYSARHNFNLPSIE